MGCTTCGTGRWVAGVCRCCELVDKNAKKQLVKFCNLCGSYLCKRCYSNPMKRIVAFGKQFFV